MVFGGVEAELPVFDAELQLGTELPRIAGIDTGAAREAAGGEVHAFATIADEIAAAEIAPRARQAGLVPFELVIGTDIHGVGELPVARYLLGGQEDFLEL
ncbi:hypothetical protein D3C87_1411880 [compost metagenome]